MAFPHYGKNKCVPFRWDKSRKLAIFSSIEIVGEKMKHLHFNKPSVGKSNWEKKVKDQGWLIKQTFWEAGALFLYILWTPRALFIPPSEESRFLHFPVIPQQSVLTFLSAAAERDTTHDFNQPFDCKSNLWFLSSHWDYLLPSMITLGSTEAEKMQTRE